MAAPIMALEWVRKSFFDQIMVLETWGPVLRRPLFIDYGIICGCCICDRAIWGCWTWGRMI